MKTLNQWFLECKTAAYEIEVLERAIDHEKPYNTQLDVLSAIERAKFNFKAAAAELECLVRMTNRRLDANKVTFKLNKWMKKLNINA